MKFAFCLFLGRLGFFTYSGMRGRHPRWWPEARVEYPEGGRSVPMAIGNAIQYAAMFDGKVVPIASGD